MSPRPIRLHRYDRQANMCKGAALPYMMDADGKLRRFKFERFKVARDAYRDSPSRENWELYFLQAVPVIAYTFTKLWNMNELIERDRGISPDEVFSEVAVICARYIKPGQVYEWHGSYVWRQWTIWAFWQVHRKYEVEMKRQLATVPLDGDAARGDADGEGATLTDLGDSFALNDYYRRVTRNIDDRLREKQVDALYESILSGRYPWRIAPDFCQYIAMAKVLATTQPTREGKGKTGLRHCDYLWRYGTPDKDLIDFLHKYVDVTIRRELVLRGSM